MDCKFQLIDGTKDFSEYNVLDYPRYEAVYNILVKDGPKLWIPFEWLCDDHISKYEKWISRQKSMPNYPTGNYKKCISKSTELNNTFIKDGLLVHWSISLRIWKDFIIIYINTGCCYTDKIAIDKKQRQQFFDLLEKILKIIKQKSKPCNNSNGYKSMCERCKLAIPST